MLKTASLVSKLGELGDCLNNTTKVIFQDLFESRESIVLLILKAATTWIYLSSKRNKNKLIYPDSIRGCLVY